MARSKSSQSIRLQIVYIIVQKESCIPNTKCLASFQHVCHMLWHTPGCDWINATENIQMIFGMDLACPSVSYWNIEHHHSRKNIFITDDQKALLSGFTHKNIYPDSIHTSYGSAFPDWIRNRCLGAKPMQWVEIHTGDVQHRIVANHTIDCEKCIHHQIQNRHFRA